MFYALATVPSRLDGKCSFSSGCGKKRMCGYADVATGKMRMLMRRRIRILPVVEIATVIANESVLHRTLCMCCTILCSIIKLRNKRISETQCLRLRLGVAIS